MEVVTTTSISTGIFSSIPKGTIGVIVDIDTGWFSTEYKVKFYDGTTMSVKADFVRVIG